MEIIDQLGRTLQIPEHPKRIVSLVPSLTELLVHIGLEDNIVGVTKFCEHPSYLRKEKKVVGGTKTIHIERIRNLKPDVIICNKEENTPKIVEDCQEVAATHVSHITSIEEAFFVFRQYGLLFNRASRVEELIHHIQSQRFVLKQNLEEKKSVKKVAYLIWKKPYMAAGGNTFIDFLLNENRLENIFKNKPSRYPEVLIEELHEADMIFLSSEPFPFKEKHVKDLQQWVDTPVILVDGTYFSWYGSRLVQSYKYFNELEKTIAHL